VTKKPLHHPQPASTTQYSTDSTITHDLPPFSQPFSQPVASFAHINPPFPTIGGGQVGCLPWKHPHPRSHTEICEALAAVTRFEDDAAAAEAGGGMVGDWEKWM